MRSGTQTREHICTTVYKAGSAHWPLNKYKISVLKMEKVFYCLSKLHLRVELSLRDRMITYHLHYSCFNSKQTKIYLFQFDYSYLFLQSVNWICESHHNFLEFQVCGWIWSCSESYKVSPKLGIIIFLHLVARLQFDSW